MKEKITLHSFQLKKTQDQLLKIFGLSFPAEVFVTIF